MYKFDYTFILRGKYEYLVSHGISLLNIQIVCSAKVPNNTFVNLPL